MVLTKAGSGSQVFWQLAFADSLHMTSTVVRITCMIGITMMLLIGEL